MKEREVIAGASAYEKKYYFNPKFKEMPEEFQKEIKEWIVPTAEKIHGILTMGYDENGEVYIEYSYRESDYRFDEIGAGLEIKKLEWDRKVFLKDLEMWYQAVFTKGGALLQKVAGEVQKGRTIEEVLLDLEGSYSNEEVEIVKKLLKQFD